MLKVNIFGHLGEVYLSRSLRDPARSPPLLLSLSRSLFLKRCIRSKEKEEFFIFKYKYITKKRIITTAYKQFHHIYN